MRGAACITVDLRRLSVAGVLTCCCGPGSTMSTHSRGEVKEASEVLADMESLWVAK